MIHIEDYRILLAALVELNTVSPMPGARIDALTAFMKRFEFRRIGNLLVKGDPDHKMWIYSHADTKPPMPRSEWEGNPFELREKDGKWFGLGISDAKFQLLNAILVTEKIPCHFVVDLMEECDGNEAGEYLSRFTYDSLLIIDGASTGPAFYKGLLGQADGEIELSTGEIALHPGRKEYSSLLPLLEWFIQEVNHAPFRFHITGINSVFTERSLTLEGLTIRFDIRFTKEQETAVKVFLSKWPVRLKQWMSSLTGEGRIDSDSYGEWAPFSTPIGRHAISCRNIIVCPGALAENGNHKPNEFIYPSQIERHQISLQKLIRSYEMRLI